MVPVEDRRLFRAFHHLPHKLYRHDPNWVAPLLLERQIHFDKKHNPFFQHAKVQFWLALRDGEPVGRITAQIDSLHLEQHEDATGHFGFIEGIDDPAVFKALLDTAEAWLKSNGMRRMLGPVSFAMWDEPGLLVEGFDRPPQILMGHHLPYYEKLIEAQGYAPAQDLLAYEYPLAQDFPEQLQRFIDRAAKHDEIRFRPLDMKNMAPEIVLIRDILNDAWQDNWGFVPMTQAEIEDIASMFRYLLKPDAVVIAEYGGETVGFAMGLPNLNEALKGLDGRLLPFGILKLLWRFKVRGVKSGRLALMGIRRKWRDTPVGVVAALLCVHKAKVSDFARPAVSAELSWILDSNERIKKMLALFGAKVVKRYRIYEKAIG